MKKKRIAILMLCLTIMSIVPAKAITGNEYRVVKCNSYITLRDEESTKADEIAKVPLSDTVIALSEAENGFYYVNYDGMRGYVLSKYLEQVYEPQGEIIMLSQDETYNINLFLSNFTEQSFAWMSNGVFDIYSASEGVYAEFGVNHVWFNRSEQIEWGEWGEYNVRLHNSQVLEAIQKYFRITPSSPEPVYVDYESPYFYWTETGGHTKDGFARLTQCEYLGANRYKIRYNVYGAGYDWRNADLKRSFTEIENQYPGDPRCGVAVIYAKNLSDRSTFFLERMAEEIY